MNNKDKKRLREIKRRIKRAGNKRLRSHFKRDLEENPEETHLGDVDFGSKSSKKFNGMDDDSTRKK